ncbi:MAG: hypothetical protein JW863_14515 [Chitinispirillaceae bacterium]|nr:hypothetical protein [Chitinispirillaceae bacterium]
MLALTAVELEKRILGCGDGPAGFNATANARGGDIISVDPLYAFSKEQIERRINETYENVIAQTRLNRDRFLWNHFSSVDELGRVRMAAIREFFATYEEGKTAAGRHHRSLLRRR